MNTTTYAAGDNYYVQGSTDPAIHYDPNFVCTAATNCQQTSPITAWKRVYVENKRMFRSGANVVAVAPAGSDQVIVEFPRGIRSVPFAVGESVRLVHAPPLHATGPREFHWEDKVIASIASVPGNRRRLVLTLQEALANEYREDPSLAYEVEDGLGDGVGRLAAGFYERNQAYITSLFQRAFVDYRAVAYQVNADLPYQPQIWLPLHLANKWFENTPAFASGARPGDSNVKHVLAGTGLPDGSGVDLGTLGQTDSSTLYPLTPFPQANDCWTFVRAIEEGVRGQTPIRNMDPWIVNGENVVHEFAHAWSVNYTTHAGTPGQCSRNMVNSALACTMNETTNRGDGIVSFHWVDDADSEFMTIRWQSEPIPAP